MPTTIQVETGLGCKKTLLCLWRETFLVAQGANFRAEVLKLRQETVGPGRILDVAVVLLGDLRDPLDLLAYGFTGASWPGHRSTEEHDATKSS